MIDINLLDLVTEPDSEKRMDKGKGWVVWRSLMLEHTDEGVEKHAVAEWFYVGACNQYYFDNSKDTKNLYVQNEFNEEELLKAVKAKFDKLVFSDWDDFYKKMQTISEWEDADRFIQDKYTSILDLFSKNRLAPVIEVVENDEALRIDISINNQIMHIIIQGLDVPEIQVKFGKVERYLSAGSTTDILSYLDKLIEDIKVILKHKDHLHISKKKFIGIPTKVWKIDISEKLNIL